MRFARVGVHSLESAVGIYSVLFGYAISETNSVHFRIKPDRHEYEAMFKLR